MMTPGTPCPTKLVVTGASGLLGANFVMEAMHRWDVVALSDRHRLAIPGVKCCQLDLTHAMDAVLLLNELQPEVIVHLAAATDVDWCEGHHLAAHRLNVGVTRTLAGWAADRGVRFVFMSTDSVFDGVRGAYQEQDPVGPVNCYATTKTEAEDVVRTRVADHLIIRASIYGWNAQPKTSLAEWVLGELSQGRQVPGFTDAIFSPTLVNTLAGNILQLLLQPAGGTYHAGSSNAASKYEFAEAVAREFGFEGKRVEPSLLTKARLRSPRPLNVSLDSRKLHSMLGNSPAAIQDDLARFRHLGANGFAANLKTILSVPHEHN